MKQILTTQMFTEDYQGNILSNTQFPMEFEVNLDTIEETEDYEFLDLIISISDETETVKFLGLDIDTEHHFTIQDFLDYETGNHFIWRIDADYIVNAILGECCEKEVVDTEVWKGKARVSIAIRKDN